MVWAPVIIMHIHASAFWGLVALYDMLLCDFAAGGLLTNMAVVKAPG